MKVLYINANAKKEENSKTLTIAREFINEYIKVNPNDQVDELNLYDFDVDFLREQDLIDKYSGQDERIKKIAEDFASYDKYIFAAPMWNLHVPAILHAYIDYVSYVSIAFKYTENGPVGLLGDKKAVFISTTGGIYDTPETIGYNFGRSYLHGIMNFFGIEIIADLILTGTNFHPEDIVKDKTNQILKEAKQVASEF